MREKAALAKTVNVHQFTATFGSETRHRGVRVRACENARPLKEPVTKRLH